MSFGFVTLLHSARLYLSPKRPSSIALISEIQKDQFIVFCISQQKTHEVQCAWSENGTWQDYLYIRMCINEFVQTQNPWAQRSTSNSPMMYHNPWYPKSR